MVGGERVACFVCGERGKGEDEEGVCGHVEESD